ncbi:MAG: hypothetical protein IJC45_08085 [Clostridia bacterium]|nr:hypothetical protein [Clostridia bacterium]
MTFELVLDLDGLTYFSDIPNWTPEMSHNFEVFYLNGEEDLQLMMSVVDDLNLHCQSLLDNGDADYFSGTKLQCLYNWLVRILKTDLNDRLQQLLHKLLLFAERAIELQTGVVIEL